MNPSSLKEKLKNLNINKPFYALSLSKIYIVKPIKVIIGGYRNYILVKINKYSKLNYVEWFSLEKNIFESKENALNELVKLKQLNLKNLAESFKKEKISLDNILNDPDKLFYHLNLNKNEEILEEKYKQTWTNSSNVYTSTIYTPSYNNAFLT